MRIFIGGANAVFVSKKISGKAIIISAAVVFFIAFALIRLFVCTANTPTTAVGGIGKYSLSAASQSAQIRFLEQFGWKVDKDSCESGEVTIPQAFNSVYERYNEIQLEQGLDLHGYEGKTCKKVSYRITNYPDSEQQVKANLLIYDGNVIGGDISSTSLGGFMHGFALEGFTEEVK